jgi:ribose transport system substrate-binding protein
MTHHRTGSVLWLLAVLAAAGCSDGDGGASKKEIARVDVPDSPFKPAGLEKAIDGLVKALGETDEQTFAMSVVTKPTGPYWEPIKVGANRAIAELGVTGQVEAPPSVASVDAETDANVATEAQIKILKTRRKDGYGGIGLAPMRDDLTEEVDALVKAGAPVVTFDSDLPDSKRQLYIGTNNAEAGKTAGETLAGLITESSGSVLVLGHDDKAWADGYARTMAAKDALENAGFTVTVYKLGWSEEEVAAAAVDLPDLITNADPPMVGIVGMFSNAFRGGEAVESLGYEPGEIKVAAFDFEPNTVSYMQKGYIQATHVQRQYYMGYLLPYAIYSIRVLGLDETVKILSKQMIDDSRCDTGVDVIEADQVDDYNDFLDTLGVGG